MKKILIALMVLIIVGVGTYYFVFNRSSESASEYGSTTTQNVTPLTPETQIPEDIKISIKNFSFDPQIITVKAGTKVTWINNDSAPHTIVSSDKLIKSPTLSTGQTFSYTFTEAKTVDYNCSIHPTMKGKVIITNQTYE